MVSKAARRSSLGGVTSGEPKAQQTLGKTRTKRKKRKLSSSQAAAPAKEESTVRKGTSRRLKDVTGKEPDAFRQEHGISVTELVGGRAVAEAFAPVLQFEELEADLGCMLAALRTEGYTQPTPVQAQVWPLVLQGHDVVAIAQTGSGKTCAFAIPILARLAKLRSRSPERIPVLVATGNACPPSGSWTCTKCGNINWPQRATCNTRSCGSARPNSVSQGGSLETASPPFKTGKPAKPSALILAPTRELTQQISTEICKFSKAAGVRTACVYGGVPKGEQAQVLIGTGADLIIATPGRCLDFLQEDRFLGLPLCVASVKYLVLDEADRMLDAGFLIEMQAIASKCTPSSRRAQRQLSRQTLFFTATWPVVVQQAASSLLDETALHVQVGQEQAGKPTLNKAVRHNVEVLDSHSCKLERLADVLQGSLSHGTCMVFCKTKTRCDWLAKRIAAMVPCTWVRAIHSGKKQREREETLHSFRSITKEHDGSRGILVATNVAGRGLDIPGVELVVVYDFSSVDDYVHQVGRTGRAGAGGRSWTFYVVGDGNAQELASVLAAAGQTVPPRLLDVVKLQDPEGKTVVPNFIASRHMKRKHTQVDGEKDWLSRLL